MEEEPKIQCQGTEDKCEAKYGIYFIMTTFLCINDQYLHTGDESIANSLRNKMQKMVQTEQYTPN